MPKQVFVTCVNGNPQQACLQGELVDCASPCRGENPHGLAFFHDICRAAERDPACSINIGDWTTCRGQEQACVGGRLVDCTGGCVDPGLGSPPYHDICR